MDSYMATVLRVGAKRILHSGLFILDGHEPGSIQLKLPMDVALPSDELTLQVICRVAASPGE
jgi:hypothetical protein